MSQMVRKVIILTMTCDIPGCGVSRTFYGDSESQATRIARELYGWKNRKGAPAPRDKRVDWCAKHWKPCPSCKGRQPLHIAEEDGTECGCNGSYHDVTLPQCETCKGRLWITQGKVGEDL